MSKAIVASAILFCSLPLFVFSQSSTSKKVNVVFILADDLGYGEVGCYGQTKILTPNIDKLAQRGVRFTQFYVGSPVCAPSRCSLLTGLHTGHATVRNNFGLPNYKENSNEPGSYPLNENEATIATLFKQAGYATAAIGKWGLGNWDNAGSPLQHGFDYFYGYYDQRQAHNYYTTHLYENDKRDTLRNAPMNVHPKFDSANTASKNPEDYVGNEYSIDKMTNKAIRFMDDNKNKPFFLYLPYTLSHAVLQAPQKKVDAYVKRFHEPHSLSITNNGIPVYYPLSTYAAQVTYLDKQVGLIVKELRHLHINNNTLIIFASDNGAADGEKQRTAFFNSCAGLRGFKSDLYEGGIRDPFILAWPHVVSKGAVISQPIAAYDLMQTVADILHIDAPRNDGVSFLPLLKSDATTQTTHPFFYWEFPGKMGQIAVRIGDYKGIKTGTKLNNDTAWQVYNIVVDSAETKDLAARQPDLIKQFTDTAKREHTVPAKPEWDIYRKPDPNAKPAKDAD